MARVGMWLLVRLDRLARHLTFLSRGDRGATAVEYGLIVTLIAVVIIGAVTGIGLALQGQFNNVLSHL